MYICENPDGFGLLSSINHRRFQCVRIIRFGPNLECVTQVTSVIVQYIYI